SPFSFMCAPICLSGSVTRRIGRLRSEASPVSVAVNLWPPRMPSMSRAVVPELPQLRRVLGAVSRAPDTVTFVSLIVETSAPSWRSTRAVLFTSPPVSNPASSLFPFANAANMRTRCEMLLSPGGRTTPLSKTAPPRSGAREPVGEHSRVARLERALHGAERLLERAQCRQDFVAIHQQDFRP